MEKVFQGDTLKKIRTYQHLSVTDLSEKTGISRNQLILLESGKSASPRYKTIEKIASALLIPIDILYRSFDDQENFLNQLKNIDEVLAEKTDKAMLNVETILRNSENNELREVEFRFPCPFDPNDNYDSTINYYESKTKEEQEKLLLMLRILKEKYGIPDDVIQEIKRSTDNIGFLKEYSLNLKISKELFIDII